MKWPYVKIDDIKSNQAYSLVGGPFGSNLITKDYTDEGIPVIRGVNLPDDRNFSEDDLVFVSEEKANSLFSNNAHSSDLIFTQRGTLGQVGLIPRHSTFDRYLISQSQMKLSVNPEKAIPEYVYYFFRHPNTIQSIKNRAITSGVPHINLGILKNFELPLPPLTIQENISRVLGTYDKLIENNRRRIELLEQAAMELYKEWFVHLRFPGHQCTKIKDGLNEGWQNIPLGELLTLQRGFDLPLRERQPGSFPIYASTGINGYHNKAKVRAPGVVTGRSGSLGTVIYVPKDYWPLNTTLWVKEFKRITPIFASHFLSVMKLEQYNGGAAVPTLNRNIVHSINVLTPPQKLMILYENCAKPIFEQIQKLRELNEKLCKARDLLLPKLMNGDIEV